jgi:hypothetical protein
MKRIKTQKMPLRGKDGKILRSNIINKRFGRLLVIEYSHTNHSSYWTCKCDCGNEKIIRYSHLARGATRSCGCLSKEHPHNILPTGEASFNKLYNSYRKTAIGRNIKFELSKEVFREIILQKCYYCGCEPSNRVHEASLNGTFIYNGIDRKDSTKDYTIDNIVTACSNCNYAKRTMHIDDFLLLIKNIYINLNLNDKYQNS